MKDQEIGCKQKPRLEDKIGREQRSRPKDESSEIKMNSEDYKMKKGKRSEIKKM